jgi:hypothetical protein
MMGRAIHAVERQRDEACEPNNTEMNLHSRRKGSQSGTYRRPITRGFCRTVSPYLHGGGRSVSVADCWPKF